MNRFFRRIGSRFLRPLTALPGLLLKNKKSALWIVPGAAVVGVAIATAAGYGSTSSVTLPQELDDAEQFDGVLVVSTSISLEMSIRLTTVAGALFGVIDIPGQGVFNLVMECSEKNGMLELTLPLPGSARFTLKRSSEMLDGSFAQNGADYPIIFTKSVVRSKPKRPQEPEAPFPYDVTELVVPTSDGHQLAGTLFVPHNTPPEGAPFVVLVTGSGRQDRNEAIMGHKPFLVLADRLAQKGIASFRYDKRGIGASGGSHEGATTKDFAHDAAAAYAQVVKDPRLDATRSGFIGHSEGALVAALVGAGEARDYEGIQRPRFVVMIAGPGVAGHAILRAQKKLLLLAEGREEKEVENVADAYGALLDGVLVGADEATLRTRAAFFIELDLALAGTAAKFGEQEKAEFAEQTVAQLISPWFQHFIEFDPRPTLRKLDMPVLIVNGDLDVQVWHEQNVPEIKNAVRDAGGHPTVLPVDGLNHLLQPAKTGGVSEYGAIETTMDENTMANIATWINVIEHKAP